MRNVAIGLSVAVLAALGWTASSAQTGAGLRAFQSDAELRAFLRQRTPRPVAVPVVYPPAPMPSPVMDSAAPAAEAAPSAPSPNITNRQEAGVDEGGIVKVHGDHLVILRRGRLFTVATTAGAMRPVDHIDAFPPGTTGQGTWYDEMLVAGNRVIVIGYSYARGGTEISRFGIGADGRLTYQDTHNLRSNDYYSSRNYASRLIGNRLIFYTPLSLYDTERWLDAVPGVRRWRGDEKGPFQRLARARDIYVAQPVLANRDAAVDTLHSVTTCDLAAPQLSCNATAILGSESRTFYVSGSAVYVWVAGAFENRRGGERSLVYRMPLTGGRPSAAQAWGGPIDQFSFREDKADGVLNVMVRADSGGDAMWRPEVSGGDAALLRLPLAQFGNGAARARARDYRSLPLGEGESWSMQNRYVGRHLLYSAGQFDARTRSSTVFAAPLAGGEVARITVPHGVSRLDAIGQDGVAIGSNQGALGFTSIELGAAARLGDTYVLPAAEEGENRSHAFFFRNDSADGSSGMLGLPVARRLERGAPRFLGAGSSILFLNRNARAFSPVGELRAETRGAVDDACQASCVDWYGNARPIFLGNRVFALMGYELVEGRVERGRIGEVARVNFAPRMSRRPPM